MIGEFLSINTVSKMSENEKKIERLTRDKNLLEKLLVSTDKKNNELSKKIISNLDTIETYLIMKLEQFNKDNDTEKLVGSLHHLINTIIVEKRLLEPKYGVKYEKKS